MYEFGLNNVKIQEIRVVGSSGTGTTWTGTGTNPFLVSGTGTNQSGTGTILLLHRWYRYQSRKLPRNGRFSLFHSLFFHTLPLFHPTSKTYHGFVKPQENPNFLKKGKMVISVKRWNFSRSRMMKQTSPLDSSRKI